MKIMKYLCHQRPDRSFYFKGKKFPICSRCTGIVLGALIFVILNFFIKAKISLLYILIAIIFTIPLIIDGTSQYFKLRESNNTLRFITGLLCGFAVSYLAFISGLLIKKI